MTPIQEAAMRENEAESYRRNIARFAAMRDVIGDEPWPEDLVAYKNPAVVVPAELDDDVEDRIARFRNRDNYAARIRSEKQQLRIIEDLIAVLRAEIGKNYDKLVAAERANPTNA